MTSRMAEAASKKPLKKAKTMEAVACEQNACKGLQKLGNAVCLMPVRFRFATPAAAEAALIIAYANT